MPVHVLYVTDPACPWSWGTEPAVRRLEAEFGAEVQITYVMVGLWREIDAADALRQTLEAAAGSGMPVDPRIWLDAPPRSSYPACLAVKAAAEQGLDGPYLRRVREAVMCERVKADTGDALTALARDVPGMNVERFAVDLGSNAIVEAFGADLDRARELGAEPPAFAVAGEVVEPQAIDAPRQALPTVEEALRRWPRLGVAEIAAVCDLPGPRAPAELWRLALEWRARATRFLTGELWSAG
ncbi:MAG TPA: DsbA family protein [Solirubrobacteraceae bacterium]|nr:DsbA family protein [Solirubrobacteraceae bacterium]